MPDSNNNKSKHNKQSSKDGTASLTHDGSKRQKDDSKSQPVASLSTSMKPKNVSSNGDTHTASDNNKEKASKTSVKRTAVASKRKTDGTGSAAPNGNNVQNEDSNSQALDSAPPQKKQKTVALNGKTNTADNNTAKASKTSLKKTAAAAAAKRKNAATKKTAGTDEALRYVHPSQPGFVLAIGDGSTGQLGLGPDVMEQSKPARVDLPADVIQICAGGMHSVCLTVKGEVYTFGCNDEGALGRQVEDEDECMTPGKVELPVNVRVVSVSAGDSHTAMLTHDGRVFIWGTFRDSNGPIGIIPGHGKLDKPVQILKECNIIKIASGSDHLVCLTSDGLIYTLGAAEQGQLGRVAEYFCAKGGRRGLDMLLCPNVIRCKSRRVRFCDIWTGQYCTFAKDKDTGDIYAWGLNNYYQLGVADMQNKFAPVKVTSFDRSRNWAMIRIGQHHTIALDASGMVHSLGRKEYGRLGLGEKDLAEKSKPTVIPKLRSKKCVHVDCGTAVSYAVDSDGKVYGWGMGSAQLGQGDSEEDVYEPVMINSKQLQNKNCLMTSAGGQHTLLLARDQF